MPSIRARACGGAHAPLPRRLVSEPSPATSHAEVHQAPLRRTPLYEAHKRAGARIVPFAGWEMPVQYTGLTDEHKAVRTAAGLFDVCHMGELALTGEHAIAVVDYLVTNDIQKLEDGQAIYTCCCNEQGTILDDLIIYRAARDRVLVVCNGANRDKISKVFEAGAKDHCDFTDKSDQTALIALQGPKAWTILAKACDVRHLATLPAFHFGEANLFNVPVTIARTGYTGEDGCEIFMPWDAAETVWEGLLKIGADDGLKPAGLGCRDTLRLECKMALYGNDIDETTNPLEAALSWTVKFDKPMFVGKAALEKAKSDGVGRKLVGIEVTGRGIARHGYPVKDASGKVVGQVTSGSPSPTTGKNIGLAYVPNALAAIGSKIVVDCRGKDVEAVVVKTPFYKRAGR
jgi:aminomethyltransferase